MSGLPDLTIPGTARPNSPFLLFFPFLSSSFLTKAKTSVLIYPSFDLSPALLRAPRLRLADFQCLRVFLLELLELGRKAVAFRHFFVRPLISCCCWLFLV